MVDKQFTITCPGCKLQTPWVPQSVEIKVMCINRDMTGMIRGQPQMAIAMYGTIDGTKCWTERYRVDLPDTEPTWICREIFRVRRNRTIKSG